LIGLGNNHTDVVVVTYSGGIGHRVGLHSRLTRHVAERRLLSALQVHDVVGYRRKLN